MLLKEVCQLSLYQFPYEKPSELVFLVVSIIDRGLGPAVGTADGGYLGLLLGSDGLLTIAPLEVESLVEGGDEVGADGLGLRLGDALVELRQAARHETLGIGTVVGTGTCDDILAVGVDDGGIERVIRCPLTDKPVEAVVLARTGGIVAQYVVP